MPQVWQEGSIVRSSYVGDATDGGTLLIYTPYQKRKLCWRRRTAKIMIRSRLQLSGPERQASAVLFQAKMGKESRLRK